VAPRVGVVAIGRNEGERLERCLRSLPPGVPTVYVDSGSSDGSVARARESGAAVVDLDADSPFTAARARNAGFERLLADTPEIEFVQFVDGDCELRPDWLRAAAVHLSSHANVAAVCGRRRERHPDASPWNRLADLEWDTPVGDARAFGGDVLIRADVFRSVGGYDATRIAGEDPDLALRIRRAGHNVERLGLEMTLHDAALASVGAWWRRAVRGGHAYAEAFYHERAAADPDLRRHIASTLFWGGLIPLVALVLAPATGGASLVAFGAWVLLGVRIYRAMRRRGRAPRDAALSAGALVACKVAELQGALTFAWNRLVLRRHTRLIEYKQGP
jgi:glycosyltransferase involved in cell wall biosynthesis